MMKRITLVMGAMVVALGLSNHAQAATVEADFLNVGPRQAVKVHNAGTNHHVYTGVYNWKQTGGTYTDLVTDANNNFDAFCIEIAQEVADPTTFDVMALENGPVPGTPIGATRAAYLSKLWGGFYDLIGSSNQLAAAFQLAVWEITHEADFNFDVSNGQGQFYARNQASTAGQANTWLSAILNDTNNQIPLEPSLVALTSDDAQDMVAVREFGTPIGEVPLPSAIWAGGMLIAGIGGMRRWRRRNADL
jgi:hypothetical protein